MDFKGVRLLRIRGIQITIDYSWFIIFLLIVYLAAEGAFPRMQGRFSVIHYWMMGVAFAVLYFASVLIHELAHSLVALRHGIEVKSIRLLFFGGLAQISSEPRTSKNEFLIALAGPATSVALAFLFGMVWTFLTLAGVSGPAAAVAAYLSMANLVLAFFNMLPGLPLDGGRILRAILWDRWNDPERATKVVSRLGNALALFLIFLGILQFFFSRNLVGGLWSVLIGLVMKQAAVGSYQAAVLREALAGTRVSQIMTENVISVDWLTSVDELVHNYIYKHQFTHFPVFNRDEMVGMVSLAQVKNIPRELWAFKQVRDIMTPIEQVPRLKPTDDATEALSRMVSEDTGRMPVMEEGRLVGIVTRRDILNLFKIKSDLGGR
jgi:Zn-dependent protease